MTVEQTQTVPCRPLTMLTRADVKAIYRLIIKRQLPELEDPLPAAEAVLIVTADLLKNYKLDAPSVLMVMARLWAWLEGNDRQGLMLNLVDRRYVGWSHLGQSVLIDMVTGEDVQPAQALPCVLESVAYNLYELLERRMALTNGTRASLWEDGDAGSQAARGEAPGGGDGLGRPPVVRDDLGPPVP